jgi:hypothetical protein
MSKPKPKNVKVKAERVNVNEDVAPETDKTSVTTRELRRPGHPGNA